MTEFDTLQSFKDCIFPDESFARVDTKKTVEICPYSNPNTLPKGEIETCSIDLDRLLLLKGWKARTFFNIIASFNLENFLEEEGLLQCLAEDGKGYPLLTAFPPVEKFEKAFFVNNYRHSDISFWENIRQKYLIFLLKRKISKWKRRFMDFDVLMHFYKTL